MWWASAKSVSLLGLVLIAAAVQLPAAHGANILGLFTSNSPSHLIVHMSVAKALAEQGHNITVVSSLKPIVNHPNIRNIIIPPAPEQEKIFNDIMKKMASQKNTIFATVANFFGSLGLMIQLQFDILQDPRFTALYESPDTKFDLVMMGFFMNDFQLGVAAKFKVPIILEWTGAPMEMIGRYVGNPTELSYVPGMNLAVKPGEVMTFAERLQNLMGSMFFRVIMAAMDYKANNFYQQLFPSDNDFPTYWDMKKNVSLVFCNGHFSEGPIRPNVPALVEIGGIQIKDKPDPLPKDLAEFMDASKEHGAILFSLGSNLQGSHINPELITIIYNVLSSLKQNVIWKWDLEKKPGNAPNILYKKWLPQDDILAHPNLKLFITHAGKGGVAEAQYHAVPMVALPVFADQDTNANAMANAGYGLQQNLLTLTEPELKKAILEVLYNPSYAQKVKEFSNLYRDRPLTAKQNVVFWTEYVLRHHGAAHMQSPLVHMNFIQSTNLDVIAFLALILYVVFRIFKLIAKFVCRKLCGNKNKYKKVKSQ